MHLLFELENMFTENICEICSKLGLEQNDLSNVESRDTNLLNNQVVTADLYKAGTRYGTISIKDF